jgi:octaprenyl-diphosphate synthase
VIEFIHTATLLHDDVVDASDLRRGRETANAMFGNSASVLVGDFLYSRAFQMMVAVNDMRIMQVLSDATNVIAEGEVLQLMNCHDADLDEAATCRSSATRRRSCSRRRRNWARSLVVPLHAIEQAMATYGIHLGTAFQLIDDVLDYSGAEQETGKHLGDDLAEGKPTLPLIFVLQNGNQRTGGLRTTRDREVAGVTTCLRCWQRFAPPGRSNTRNRRPRRRLSALPIALDLVPTSQYKDSLLELCLFAVARSY